MKTRYRPPGLVVWVIYEHPDDYPEHFVVRTQVVGRGDQNNSMISFGLPIFCATLEEARAEIPPDLVRLSRAPGDVPAIVESWI
jgi:hypothetical protein